MALNKRILIVDDQQDLREQMAKLLSRSSKKSETVSLVRQMRSRLLGAQAKQEEPDDEPERGGYEIDTAGQGQEALEKVQRSLEAKKPFAAMFLDMRMPPGWDGLETAKRIREIDKRIEIVIMTAYADHDQETVAKCVGAPDKLLYIKKPFQSEEIFQLALCLTSKWSAEEDERFRKGWLEALIKGMSRMKGLKSDKFDDVCGSVLKAFLAFSGAQKGLITTLCDGKWKLENATGVDAAEAAGYLTNNADTLSECRTAQSLEGKYAIPLRREGCTGLVVLYDAGASNDPEWYKLLNLLVMTASDVLSSAASQNEQRKVEREKAVACASAKIAAVCKPTLASALSEAGALKAALKEEGSLKRLAALEAALKEVSAAVDELDAFGSPKAASPSGKTQIPALLQELASEIKSEATIQVAVEVAGLASAPIACPAGSLKAALKRLALSRAKTAEKAGAGSLSLKFDVKPDGQGVRISLEDDAPALPKNGGSEAFDEELAGFDLTFPTARKALKAAGLSLSAESGRAKGALFRVALGGAPEKTEKL